MGGERVEVEGQAITGKDRPTTSGQSFGGVVDELMSERLGARAEGEGRDPLGAGVRGDPMQAGPTDCDAIVTFLR